MVSYLRNIYMHIYTHRQSTCYTEETCAHSWHHTPFEFATLYRCKQWPVLDHPRNMFNAMPDPKKLADLLRKHINKPQQHIAPGQAAYVNRRLFLSFGGSASTRTLAGICFGVRWGCFTKAKTARKSKRRPGQDTAGQRTSATVVARPRLQHLSDQVDLQVQDWVLSSANKTLCGISQARTWLASHADRVSNHVYSTCYMDLRPAEVRVALVQRAIIWMFFLLLLGWLFLLPRNKHKQKVSIDNQDETGNSASISASESSPSLAKSHPTHKHQFVKCLNHYVYRGLLCCATYWARDGYRYRS